MSWDTDAEVDRYQSALDHLADENKRLKAENVRLRNLMWGIGKHLDDQDYEAAREWALRGEFSA